MTKRIGPRLFYDTIDWSVDQYHGMVEAGLLAENAPVELLHGKIVPMSPVGRFHAACVDKFQEYFTLKFQKSYSYRGQNPVAMLDDSEPEPDFVVAVRDENNYADGHPDGEKIFLLVEVSDSTLDKDRHYKKSIYAEAGVREYWIANLVDRQIEVYTQPVEDDFTQATIFGERDTIVHERWGEVLVAELLPGL